MCARRRGDALARIIGLYAGRFKSFKVFFGAAPRERPWMRIPCSSGIPVAPWSAGFPSPSGAFRLAVTHGGLWRGRKFELPGF